MLIIDDPQRSALHRIHCTRYIGYTVHFPVRQCVHSGHSLAQCLTGGVNRQTVSVDQAITHKHNAAGGHIVVRP
jgi:hypothetical protein